MLRGAAFLLLACWVASDSSAASVQPGSAGQCSAKAIDITLRGGGTPDVRGCDLERLFNSLRELRLDPTIVREDDPELPSGTVSKITVGDDVATIHVSTGAPPRPRFSIGTAATVQEGGRLTISVLRQGNADRSHDIRFITDRTELLEAAIPPITFPSTADEHIFDIVTAVGRPGDGDQKLRIALATDDSADAGDPVTVTITDTPATEYSIEPPSDVRRGDLLEFTVSRSDARRADSVDYYFTQDGRNFRPKGARHPLIFDEGDETESLTLPNDAYLPCKLPPTLILRQETPVQATASFLDQPPAYCDPPPKFPPPWWWIPACIFGIAATGYGTRKYWFPWPKPNLYPKWTLAAVEPTGETSVPVIPGWPSFSARTDLEWGGASLPQPLPIAEEANG